jgi:integrase
MNDQSKWEQRVFLHRGGAVFHVKLQHGKRRETFSTRQTNRRLAAVEARRISMELQTLGWEATLAKRKPEEQAPAPELDGPTVGTFLEAVRRQYTGQPRTISDYGRTFRRIVADIAGIERDEKKFDYVNGGRLAWIELVDAVPLHSITAERIAQWKVAFLDAAGDDLTRRRSAQTTFNSYLRQCRSLFSARRCLDAGIENPFALVKFEPAADMRYRSALNVEALCLKAVRQLPAELCKAFLLAVCAGLRRNELDKLEWTAFDWNAGTIHVGPTRYLHVKSQRSIGDVDLDPETVTIFRGFYARRRSSFVIESHLEARPRAAYSHYRTAPILEALCKWLREEGVNSPNPIHALRKEFGSLVNQLHGIHAASSALRHADIAITSKHYVAKKSRTAVGLGVLIAPAEKVVAIDAAFPSAPPASAVL